MSEKKRAFLALRGDVFPRIGDRGTYHGGIPDDLITTDVERTVEIVRLSASGTTIWTRFLYAKGQLEHGDGQQSHRWARKTNHVYIGNGFSGPVGKVTFR
jgi:hypothetical protein